MSPKNLHNRKIFSISSSIFLIMIRWLNIPVMIRIYCSIGFIWQKKNSVTNVTCRKYCTSAHVLSTCPSLVYRSWGIKEFSVGSMYQHLQVGSLYHTPDCFLVNISGVCGSISLYHRHIQYARGKSSAMVPSLPINLCSSFHFIPFTLLVRGAQYKIFMKYPF